jgi:translation initiation factor IF-2
MSNDPQKNAEKKQRPPIVVVMGHVDHGKTTLLDHIRKASVAAREAGGITQAVGAYEIVRNGRKITFIDTPGHEAFSAMRSRGAQAADLAILVVAADEGVKPQTKEAIKILEDTKTPFVVAINKIDKTNGNIDKAKNDLMGASVFLEGYGGSVSYQGISAKSGDGVDALLDLVLLAADMEDLSYDPTAPASGYILEARRDPRRGLEVSAIVKNGTLRRGDKIQTQSAEGKVKILEDFLGHVADSLEPSAPAIVIGFENLPVIGEEFSVGESINCKHSSVTKGISDVWKVGGGKANGQELNLLLKASDAGSLEALAAVLSGIGEKDQKGIAIVDKSVGDITDSDVKTALATGATIVGFKNRVEKGAQNFAEAQGLAIVTSKIVYEIADAVAEFLAGKRGPQAVGKFEILAVFNQEKLDKQLVGGRVMEGIIRGKASFDMLRKTESGAEEPAGSGKILSLREKKSELTQAEKGKEIGVLVNSPATIKIGDVLVVKK